MDELTANNLSGVSQGYTSTNNWTGNHDNTTTAITTAINPFAGLENISHYVVAFYINKYYLYVIATLGLPGNIAAIMTFCTMTPLTSSSVYMIVLAIVDTGSIVIKVVYLDLTKFDIQMGNDGCRSVFLLGTFLMHYANWILVAMTIERFLAIWRPLRVAELCTRRRAAYVLALIGIILLALDLHFIWSTVEGWDDFYKWNCEFAPEYIYFMSNIWYWIDGVVYSLLPFAILLFFNTLIIVGLRRQQKRMALKVDKTKLTEKMKQQQQLTFMLISISVVFVLLTMPNCAIFIIQNYWDYMANAEVFARYYLIYQLAFVLSDANHAVNFYLYCLTGRKFRQYFFRLLVFCCCCRGKSSLRNQQYLQQHELNNRSMTFVSHVTTSTRRTAHVSMGTNGGGNEIVNASPNSKLIPTPTLESARGVQDVDNPNRSGFSDLFNSHI